MTPSSSIAAAFRARGSPDSPTLQEMLLTTTSQIEGMRVLQYHDIVIGEAIVGANILRDYFARIRDIVGGRATAYEKAMNQARRIAFRDLKETAASLGANAVIGVDIDYEIISKRGSMLMVSITGTAVTVTTTHEPGLG